MVPHRAGARWVLALALGAVGCVSTDGPGIERLWERELGPGYSGIAVEDGRLYTMYRRGDDEVVVALDASDGRTLWSRAHAAPPVAGLDLEYGTGPNASPVADGDRVFTVGFTGRLQALDAADGATVWTRELWSELGGNVVELGYSARPVLHGDAVIVLVGGPDRGAVAFERDTGEILWESPPFETSYASPVVMTLDGVEQLVAFTATEVRGIDLAAGRPLWSHGLRNAYPQNICTPFPIDERTLFVSTLGAESRALRVAAGDPWEVGLLWSTPRLQCFYGTYARIGGAIYGSSGDGVPAILVALDAASGDVAWRSRTFGLSHVVAVGEDLLLLDDEGLLTLARPAGDGPIVLARARVLSSPARTPPTVVGHTAYLRDGHRVAAWRLPSP